MRIIKGADLLKLGKVLANLEAWAEYFKARAESKARLPKNVDRYQREVEE